jgi:hypothetical protein
MSSPSLEACRGVSASTSLDWTWLVSSGESLDSEYDRHDGGVFNVVTLLGAFVLEDMALLS